MANGIPDAPAGWQFGRPGVTACRFVLETAGFGPLFRDDRREMDYPSLHVVIVNWNSGRQLSECLGSFAAVAGDRVAVTRITVVDNASTDGSCDGLAASLPLTVIRNGENRGFAAACNQGAAGSEAAFLLFLNPDTRLMAGALERPARFLRADENMAAGIVGIQLLDSGGHVARNTARMPTPWSMLGNSLGLDRLVPSVFPPHFVTEWAHDETRTVDQVMGAFMLVRRTLFETLGGFDERFVVYFEDLDLACRARARGFASVYLATAQAFHRGQGTTESAIGTRTYLFCRSRILFALKWFSTAGAFLVVAATLLLEPFARALKALMSRGSGSLRDVARAYALLWSNLPAILKLAQHPQAGADPRGGLKVP
jgi:N-acetylglucosaminyl-diphospho-decaprenol L-rhamnosyltransferase